jgi:ribosomal protein S18 acetylase RimI-like enzyme
MTIKRIVFNNIDEVVHLHLLCFPDTTTSLLGLGYVTKTYATLYRFPEHHLILGMFDGNRIVGILTATDDLSFTISQLSPSLFGSDLFLIIKKIILGQLSVTSLVQRFLFEKSILKNFAYPYATILTLFVHPSYRRKGIARKLIGEALTWSKRQKLRQLFVDTEITNHTAQRMYTNLGFIQKKTIFGEVVLAIQL